MQDNSLQLAVAQAMQQNHQRNMQQQGAQNRQQYGMPSAFMQYPNDNYSMRQAANPYFLPEPQNLYITQQPDYWNQSNPMQWGDYTQQMQQDYGAFSPPQQAQAAPQKAANPDWWDTRMRVDMNYVPRGVSRNKQFFDGDWIETPRNPFTGQQKGSGLYGYAGETFGSYISREMPWVNPASLTEEQALALRKKAQAGYLASNRASAEERRARMKNLQEQGG